MLSNFHLLDLPHDVLTFIVLKLSHGDAVSLAATCRNLQALVNSDSVWLPLCERLEVDIDLKKWRSQALSGKALYRLLRAFKSMIGTWSSKDLSPRGALLFVTWGNFSLIGLKVVPQCMGNSPQRGNVSFMPLFEVLGNRDGSTQVELVSKTTELRLPVDFLWSSPSKKEFHLDVFAEGENGPESSDENRDESEDSLRQRDTRVRQALLNQGFALGPDDVNMALIPPPGYEQDQQQGMTIARLARQYLLRLASLGSSRAKPNVRVPERFRGCRYSYQKLLVEQGVPGKELAGLWTGIYGPHGLEIISVSYQDNLITATKVLGDPNVPSNEITFYVDTASECRDIQSGLQSLAAALATAGNREPANVTVVYKGFGRIARYNFRNPQWVPGQLLVDKNGRMSFLWEDVNFVIQFRRLDLKALHRTGELQKQGGWFWGGGMDL